jgi:GNAT superfamily N-acetyltransferase
MNKDLELRMYKPHDIPRCVHLLMNAIPQLPNYRWITPDEGRIRYVLEHNIDNAAAFAGWVLCDSHDVVYGFGGAWCVCSLMSYDFVADDIFLWVEPEYRTYKNTSKLFHAYVEWAKGKGAKLIRASHTGGSFPKGSKEAELFNAILERQGFKEVGAIFHWSGYGEN